MSNEFLAIFCGNRNNPRMQAWMALPEAERKEKEQKGIAAWKAWMIKHQNVVVGMGGPLGKTKRIYSGGIDDVSNNMGGFVVVRAQSHEEAARFFENHPHFTDFPGEYIDLMPVLPIPA